MGQYSQYSTYSTVKRQEKVNQKVNQELVHKPVDATYKNLVRRQAESTTSYSVQKPGERTY
jgi:hypothetical protein